MIKNEKTKFINNAGKATLYLACFSVMLLIANDLLAEETKSDVLKSMQSAEGTMKDYVRTFLGWAEVAGCAVGAVSAVARNNPSAFFPYAGVVAGIEVCKAIFL